MPDKIMEDANDIDASADGQIASCFDPQSPKSFFLYAGAGSGKTRSLVKVLAHVREESGKRLWLRGQRIGVITYTNAACDEIRRRLEFSSLIEVSTIHSFAWTLIEGFTENIRIWLHENLKQEIVELQTAQAKGRAGSKAAKEREVSIESKQQRLEHLPRVQRFVYSPTENKRGRDALAHAEVINITSALLTTKPLLQTVLTSKFPMLLVDESQDTNRHLMDALVTVQALHEHHFTLGLFGDTMQRIYADGKVGLGESLPASWLRPAKVMNHRCPLRVIRLINRIRADVDSQVQRGRTDKAEGFARLFLLGHTVGDKAESEKRVVERMAKITGDAAWLEPGGCKALILEHHMAAKRLGFENLFGPLYEVDHFRTGLLEGTLPAMRFFTEEVLPLVEALTKGDKFGAAAILRKYSPMLSARALKASGKDQIAQINRARESSLHLLKLWETGGKPSLLAILQNVCESGLLDVPDALKPFAHDANDGAVETQADFDHESEDTGLQAWKSVLETSFDELQAYERYVNGDSPFGTHQGVKGLEFDRVMVIVDDESSRGFLFSYEKLFGTKGKSETDLKNESQGIETTIDRTRRLFYVTCSRAKESLAVVAYCQDPQRVKQRVMAEAWFEDSEVELLT
ncbi:MAG TPA: UvrD-helicase domain-containing protein [Acidobacteriaceae bacterium]